MEAHVIKPPATCYKKEKSNFIYRYYVESFVKREEAHMHLFSYMCAVLIFRECQAKNAVISNE